MEPIAARHLVDVLEVSQACENAPGGRWIGLHEYRGILDRKCLADDRGMREERTVGGGELIEASAKRSLQGQGQRLITASSAAARELDDEQRVAIRASEGELSFYAQILGFDPRGPILMASGINGQTVLVEPRTRRIVQVVE